MVEHSTHNPMAGVSNCITGTSRYKMAKNVTKLSGFDVVAPGSTVVEHSTHNLMIGGSNCITGTSRYEMARKCYCYLVLS